MIRWSDNDRRFGPFTFARDRTRDRTFGVVLKSSNDEGDPAYGRIHLFGATFLWALPSWLIRPHRMKVKFTRLSDSERERLGRDWYWSIHERAFGFCLRDGALHTYFGAQTDEWPGCKSKVYFLPWRAWRHVRHSLYDANGILFAHLPDRDWEVRRELQQVCPAPRFAFRDFDDEEITATTSIEEREWLLGEGRFKWLSWFVPAKVKRSLDLHFSSEVGRRKGSWKGGTIGHSIEMLPNEMHEAAFRRYCIQEGLTFIGAPGAQP